jgi:hypothetical protein
MNLERFCIKFFAQSNLDDAVFIGIFHEWIRLKKLAGILLDVADYRHVPEGPGIMLITHEINYAMDYTDGQFGLFAQRKLGPGDNHLARLLELIRATATFGALLESDQRINGNLKLEAGKFHYMANDRLIVPNSDDGFAIVQPELETVSAQLYPGQTVSVSRLENDSRGRLTAVIDSGGSVGISDLLGRL